ncbi:PepSY domain-containing protein [Methylophaga sp. OBS4]|uniref:PepSY domain-containing protein n=1 Tax=Methylophaga sp. OBS4 TaxID=2991935 RepID=UPI00225AB511|nr:hypothetical protein [Methylophaga sp. OBS4]MCX4186330.1 hypothetical protein [Methylophaga sp. OBS4]
MLNFRYLPLIIMLTSLPAMADHLPYDLEPGTSINEIALPLTKHTAAELARIETGGKVLSVDEERRNNHIIFRVKVLHNNGKVKVHRIDRDTGHAAR